MADSAVLKDYACSDFTAGRWTRPVYRRGHGHAVIVIHEMPGLHPLVVRFANRVAEAGMTVFLPSLFGEPGRPVSPGYALGEMFKGICIRREFHVWAQAQSSPIVDWCRALARTAHAECGGRGVGAVGMCFTENFALAMMTGRRCADAIAAIMRLAAPRQGGDGGFARRDRLRPAALQGRISMMGPLQGDRSSPQRASIVQNNFGDKFEAIELEDTDAAPAPASARVGADAELLTRRQHDQGGRAPSPFFKERTQAQRQKKGAGDRPKVTGFL